VTATFKVTDESGVSDRYLNYDCNLNYAGNRYIFADSPTERISGDDKDGIYQCIFTITTSAIPGTYRFSASSMGDIWGNITGSSLAPSDISLTITN
ncbi:hypothetical protein OAD25_05300, partial [Gammaproteobacteria bacterium]|nr:hypothetical protein [Gammaproteobacteria bacterium]